MWRWTQAPRLPGCSCRSPLRTAAAAGGSAGTRARSLRRSARPWTDSRRRTSRRARARMRKRDKREGGREFPGAALLCRRRRFFHSAQRPLAAARCASLSTHAPPPAPIVIVAQVGNATVVDVHAHSAGASGMSEGAVYTLLLRPLKPSAAWRGPYDVHVQVPPGACSDRGGRPNLASNPLTLRHADRRKGVRSRFDQAVGLRPGPKDRRYGKARCAVQRCARSPLEKTQKRERRNQREGKILKLLRAC